jgi:sugar lactone lactonase YvrE
MKLFYRFCTVISFFIVVTTLPIFAQPNITSFTPTSGAGGSEVTITGTDFTGTTSITIGGQPVHRFWVSSATTIVAIVGSGITGSIEVRSTNGIGTSGTNFTVTSSGVFESAPNVATLVLGQTDFVSSTPGVSNLKNPFSIAVDPTSGKVFVADVNNHRVLRYASYDALSNGIAPEGVLGQPDFTSSTQNNGGLSATSLLYPIGVSVDGSGRLWVADGNNNRVLRYDNASSKPNGGSADGVLGQPDFTSNASNNGGLSATSLRLPTGVSVDGNGGLWISDRNNHRVLHYDNASSKSNGGSADGVLGQSDFTSGTSNNGGLSSTSLWSPYGVSIDGSGRLWVADGSNFRVLRYDNASSKPNGGSADGVLGQPDFTSATQNNGGLSSTSLGTTRGISIDGDDRLWVVDAGNNRVLRYDNASSKSNGGSADGVLGQPDFVSNSSNISSQGLTSPSGVSIDDSGRLWVADYFGNRVLVYQHAPAPTISSMSPASTSASVDALTLTISGANFINTSASFGILNSSGVTTLTITPTIVSSSATQLVLSIPAGSVQTVGTVTVTVANYGVLSTGAQ